MRVLVGYIIIFRVNSKTAQSLADQRTAKTTISIRFEILRKRTHYYDVLYVVHGIRRPVSRKYVHNNII